MTNEQPEQWAKDLLEAVHDASDIGTACGMVDCPQCAKAALTIQRAFAEREAELVVELRANISVMEDALTQIAGSHYERFGVDQTDIDELPDLSADEAMNLARTILMDTAALKSREAGHG